MRRLDNGNHVVRAPVGLRPHVSSDSNPNPNTMVGLMIPQVDDDEVTEDVLAERLCLDG